LLDIYPTLAELCSGAVPPELEGRSLVPAMQNRDEDPARIARTMVFHYDPAARRDVISRTVISATWRYTEWDGGAAGRELYARADDPLEYRNRATDPAQAAAVQA